MGVPSQAQIHSWTDKVAAMLGADLAGAVAQQSPQAIAEIWDLVAASGDPDVRAALEGPALALARQVLPENYATLLPQLFSRGNYSQFCTALNGLVSGAGTPYASFAAYLTDKAAVLHPLFGELMRKQIGPTVFGASGSTVGLFAPAYQSVAPTHVYTGVDGALVDQTAAAASAAAADVAFFASNNDKVYLGFRNKFDQVAFGLSTLANADTSLTAKFYNGNAWTAFTGLVNNCVGFTKNDTLKWTRPSDWERSYQDASGNNLPSRERLYYALLQRTQVTVATPPVASCIRLVPAPVFAADGVTHLGVEQPPLAIGRITAPNVIIVEVLYAPDPRFVYPALQLRAAGPFGANVTFTIAYINQAGANVTQAQGAWASPAALATTPVALNGADTGAKAILAAGSAVVASSSALGVFFIEVPLLRTPVL